MTGMRISERALMFVVCCEVTSRDVYVRRHSRPTWPKGASGVTIGIGFDLGYLTREECADMLAPYLPADMIEALLPACGVKGLPAKALAEQLHDEVSIPWEIAMAIYEERMVPRHEAATILAFPGSEKLHPDCFGALFSLVLNRGAGMGHPGDGKREEMRLIRQAVAANDLEEIPGLIREMKRLWVGDPDMRGLIIRRDAEAELFEAGLAAMRGAPLPAPPPALTPPKDAAQAPPATPTLRNGASGTAVRILQEALTEAGFRAIVDGRFGPGTEAAVKDFQFSVGLTADGVAGPKTMLALKMI